MGDHPGGLLVSQTRYRAAIDNLEETPFGLDCGVGSLVEYAPHVAVAFAPTAGCSSFLRFRYRRPGSSTARADTGH